MDCVVVDILRFGSTALFDVGVDVDPSDNNNIVGVIRTPQTIDEHASEKHRGADHKYRRLLAHSMTRVFSCCKFSINKVEYD